MAEYIKRDDLFALSRDYTRYDGKWEEAVPVKAIRNIPSADVAEVRHGTWHKFEKGTGGSLCYGFIVMKTAYRCSKCGKDVWEMSDFCPNCGADMRSNAK